MEDHKKVNEIVPPHQQPLAPSCRVQQQEYMIFEEDNLYADGDGATRAIVLPMLPPTVKFTITISMIQLLNLKGMFREVDVIIPTSCELRGNLQNHKRSLESVKPL